MRTKNEYMQELARHIRSLPEQDRRELLADYEEHFEAGRQNGKKEEEICRSLGTPKSVAQEIRGHAADRVIARADADAGTQREKDRVVMLRLGEIVGNIRSRLASANYDNI